MITGAILLVVAFIAIPKMELPQYGILFGGIGATFVLGAFTSGGVFAIGLCIMFFGLIVTLAVALFTKKSRRNSIVAAALAGLLAVGTILVLPSLTTTSRALSETPIVSGAPGAAILAGSQAVTADAPVTIECSSESLRSWSELVTCVNELPQSDADAYKSYMNRAPELSSWNEVLQYADLEKKTGADLRVITIFNANMSDAEARNAVRQDIGASADALPIVNAGSGSLVNTRGVTTGSFEEFRDNRSQVRVMLVPPMETKTTASFTLTAGSKPMADISYAQKGVGVLTECKNPSRGIVVHVPATPDTTQTPPVSHNPPSSTTPPDHNPPPVVPPTPPGTPEKPKCEGKDCSPTTPPPGKCKENCNEEPPPDTCKENPSKCEEEPPTCEGKGCTPPCTDNCTPPPGGCKENCNEEPPPDTCKENPSKCEEDEGKDPSKGPQQPEHHEPVDAPDPNQGESTPPVEDDPANPDTAPDAGSPNAGETDAPGVDEPTEDNQHEVPADRDDDVAPVEDDPATGEVDGSDSPFGGNTNESQESNSTEQQDTTSGSSQEADTTSDSDTVSSNNDSPSSNQGESEPPTVEVELASMSTDNGGTMMDFAIVLSLGITLGAAFVLRYRVRQS